MILRSLARLARRCASNIGRKLLLWGQTGSLSEIGTGICPHSQTVVLVVLGCNIRMPLAIACQIGHGLVQASHRLIREQAAQTIAQAKIKNELASAAANAATLTKHYAPSAN